MFSLDDDGTLDTIVTCDMCSRSERYNFDTHDEDCNQIANGDCDCYGRFIDWVINDAEQIHDCLLRQR